MRGKNFLLTMLRLAKERDELRVVCDQYGAPTWSRTVADTTALLLAQARAGGDGWWEQHSGMYHLSSQGQTTWCGFTEAIIDCAGIAIARWCRSPAPNIRCRRAARQFGA